MTAKRVALGIRRDCGTPTVSEQTDTAMHRPSPFSANFTVGLAL